MNDLIRMIVVMSLSGSIIAVLLFALKPLVRDRLPKAAQYYLWLVVVAALLLPISKIFTISDNQPLPIPAAPIISETVTRYIVTQEEELDKIQGIALPNNKDDLEYLRERQEAQSPLSLATTVFMLIYPAGVVFMLLYFIISYSVYVGVHRRRNRATNAEELALLAGLCENGRAPRLNRNPLAATPMLFGLFRPMIILPDRAYTDAQLRSVLLHELTHLRRGDVLVKWLSVLVSAIHWFNPVVWLVRREIDHACELACDEAVIRDFDTDGKQKYGDTLIYVAADSKTPHAVLSTTMCEEKKALKERLGAIMKHKNTTRLALICSVTLVVLLAGCAAILGAGSGTAAGEPESGAADPAGEAGGLRGDAGAAGTQEPNEPEPVASREDFSGISALVSEIRWPLITEITNEDNLILFGSYYACYINHDGAWVPKESVEAVLHRYFGVEEIHHENSPGYTKREEITDFLDDLEPDCDGFYWMDGVGFITYDWANVTSLREAGDGTWTAATDLYSTFGDWDDSFLGDFSQWRVKDGVEIIDTDWDTLWDSADRESGDIYRYGSCLLTLKPFVYEGAQTWQIVGVNGVEIPRVLFPEA